MKTATFIRNINVEPSMPGHTINQRLYKMSPALKDNGVSYKYVVVSKILMSFNSPVFAKLKTKLPDTQETFIFGSTETGDFDAVELQGSTRGNVSHKKVLESIGYSVVEKPITIKYKTIDKYGACICCGAKYSGGYKCAKCNTFYLPE